VKLTESQLGTAGEKIQVLEIN